MESGSSGSFQSSSAGVGGGGDEENESSRGDSISSFLNSHQRNPFFHPPSNQNSQNLDIPLLPENTNFQHHQYDNNEQMGWPRGYIRSSRGNYGNLGNFSSLPSSSSQPLIVGTQNPLADSLLQSSGGSGGGGETAIYNPTTGANKPPPPPPPPEVDYSTKSTNPKKRTRASRKAPTTVLTTDTTNFRQMVQEFTGIPAPPFSTNPGGSALGRRLNIFSSAGTAFVRGSHQLDHMGSFYPLRPSAQRLTNNPNSLLGNNNPNSTISTISNNTLGLPQHLKQPHPHQNVLSMQNQLLNFQPLLQSSLSPSFNSGSRPHQESPSMSVPLSLDELGSFINQQRSSQVERQATWRDDHQGGRNLSNEGQDGQHQ